MRRKGTRCRLRSAGIAPSREPSAAKTNEFSPIGAGRSDARSHDEPSASTVAPPPTATPAATTRSAANTSSRLVRRRRAARPRRRRRAAAARASTDRAPRRGGVMPRSYPRAWSAYPLDKRFSAGKPLLGPMPPGDVVLAELPAEEDGLAVTDRREV